MGALNNRIPGRVKTIIAKYGTMATFVTHSIDQYDASTGRVEKSEPSEYSAPVSPPEPFDTTLVDGVNVKASDLVTLVSALGLSIIPQLNSLVTVLGVKYRILRVSPIPCGDNIAAYELQLRQ